MQIINDEEEEEEREAPLIVVLPSSSSSFSELNGKDTTTISGGFKLQRKVLLGLLSILLVTRSLVTTSHTVQRWLSIVGFYSHQQQPSPDDDDDGLIVQLRQQEEGVMIPSPSILDTVARWKANGEPFGECGQNQSHTSLSQTAAYFSSNNSEFALRPLLSSSSLALPSSSSSNFENRNHHPLAQLSLTFQAMDSQGRHRTLGGDEFVVTIWVWTNRTTTSADAVDADDSSNTGLLVAYKQAAVANDLGTGRYQVSLTIPQFGIEHVKLTLMHYYTCYQGLGPHKPAEPFWKLEFGPQNVIHNPLQEFLQRAMLLPPLPPPGSTDTDGKQHATTTTTTAWQYFQRLPYCETSQKGLDDFTTKGLWVESQPEVAMDKEITLEAKWKSVICQPPPKKEDYGGALRIGDSTMTKPNLEIGDAFHHYIEFGRKFNHHKRWVKYLFERLLIMRQQQYQSDTAANQATANNSKVLVFSGGLHQLYQRNRYGLNEYPVVRGYNVPTAVDLLIRMLCQLALVHPDRKLLLIGIGPVHQQLYDMVDNTDQNVLWFNALLRRRILEQHDGRLSDICSNDHVKLSNLFSIPDDNGNAQNQTIARRAFEAFGYQEPVGEQKLARILSKMESMRPNDVYGNRTVAFADIHDILLARPECFKDKIHDNKVINYHGRPSLHVSQHHAIIDTLARMRGEMKDP